MLLCMCEEIRGERKRHSLLAREKNRAIRLLALVVSVGLGSLNLAKFFVFNSELIASYVCYRITVACTARFETKRSACKC
jgi:hypothetical protein